MAPIRSAASATKRKSDSDTTKVAKVQRASPPKQQSSLFNFLSASSTSPTKVLPSRSQEELDLEEAIQASLRDHQEWLSINKAIGNAGSGGSSTVDPNIEDDPIIVEDFFPTSSLAFAAPVHDAANEVLQAEQHALDSRVLQRAASTENEAEGSNTNKKKAGNAFSVLMTSHKEHKEWNKADEVEAANYRGKARSRPDVRTAPFYKVMQGMPLSVDAFRFGRIEGCTGYFLTHFHSDHYGGLTASWQHGLIYCSQATANLVRLCLKVEEKWIRPLEMETPTLIADSGGVTVTCIEANHCPGSCLFLFEGPQTVDILASAKGGSSHLISRKPVRYLHCGDFRASPVHAHHPRIKNTRIDIIYLDTTYLNPRYCFPAQEQVVEACAEMVKSRLPISQRERNADDDPEKQKLKPAFGDHMSVDQKASAALLRNWLASASSKATSASDLDDLQIDTDLGDSGERTLGLGAGEDTLGFDADEEDAWRDANQGFVDQEPESAPVKEETANASVVPLKEEEDEKPGFAWMQLPSKAAEGKRMAGRLLVVIGTYTIGKEKIVKAVARVMGSQIFCADSRKYRIYAQLEDPELHGMLTRDPGASVHVTNLQAINAESLRDTVAALRKRGYGFTHAIAFRPTGWTYRPPAGMDNVSPALDRVISWNQSRDYTAAGLYPTRDSTPDYMIYGVPYSEHSSFVSMPAHLARALLTAESPPVRVDRLFSVAQLLAHHCHSQCRERDQP